MSGPHAALTPELRERCANTIRFLAVDAVEAAASGHPGAPMGMADMAFVLWTSFLRFDPAQPDWPDRDRFVLSAGHASTLQYAMLHLTGYDLPLDDLKRFRQWESRAPGHPEYRVTPGVELSTGPLGQGFATAVGMALAGRMAAARYNRPGHEVVTYRVFGICGDGDMMEGISYEAASFAGNLGLGNLTFLYDSNDVTIEGDAGLALGEDVGGRFAAMGWHVQRVDGHDHAAVEAAIRAAVAERERPSFIVARTEIARGAPTMKGTARTHGAPLGADEVRRAKEAAGWPLQPTFHVPNDAREVFARAAAAGREKRQVWEATFHAWRAAFPELAGAWDAAHGGRVPADLDDRLLAAAAEAKGKATRTISNRVLQAAHKAVPALVGGSADLGPSNETLLKEAGHVLPSPSGVDFGGANLHFGVREHAMGAIANGLSLHGGFRPYVATFLVFSDYLKPSVRLAAIMDVPTVFVFTHDSYAVGEDGPTHQPVEHLWMLRSIPGMKVFRPADHVEVAAAWSFALRRRTGPVAIALTRQSVPSFERQEGAGVETVLRGGYVVREAGPRPDAILVATGSEVATALTVARALEARGAGLRVVSMPCLELFHEQTAAYRDTVFLPGVRVATLEAGATFGWHRVCGTGGLALGLDRFGASAPASVLEREFGFTPDAVASCVGAWLGVK
jgi:transketolase